jgi:hypothetical protein
MRGVLALLLIVILLYDDAKVFKALHEATVRVLVQ